MVNPCSQSIVTRRSGVYPDGRWPSQAEIYNHRIRGGRSTQLEQMIILAYGRIARNQCCQPFICAFQIGCD